MAALSLLLISLANGGEDAPKQTLNKPVVEFDGREVDVKGLKIEFASPTVLTPHVSDTLIRCRGKLTFGLPKRVEPKNAKKGKLRVAWELVELGDAGAIFKTVRKNFEQIKLENRPEKEEVRKAIETELAKVVSKEKGKQFSVIESEFVLNKAKLDEKGKLAMDFSFNWSPKKARKEGALYGIRAISEVRIENDPLALVQIGIVKTNAKTVASDWIKLKLYQLGIVDKDFLFQKNKRSTSKKKRD